MYITGHSSYQLAYDVSGQNVDPRSEEILRENFQSFMTHLTSPTNPLTYARTRHMLL